MLTSMQFYSFQSIAVKQLSGLVYSTLHVALVAVVDSSEKLVCHKEVPKCIFIGLQHQPLIAAVLSCANAQCTFMSRRQAVIVHLFFHREVCCAAFAVKH